MYRLNGLLIADQIRTNVAAEMRLGRAILPPPLPPSPSGDTTFPEEENPVWPPLNFGWTLADVVNNTNAGRLNDSGLVDKSVPPKSGGGVEPPSKGVRVGENAVSPPVDGGEEGDDEGDDGEGGDGEWKGWSGEGEDMMGRMASRLMSKLAAEERLNKKKKLGRSPKYAFCRFQGVKRGCFSKGAVSKSRTLKFYH